MGRMALFLLLCLMALRQILFDGVPARSLGIFCSVKDAIKAQVNMLWVLGISQTVSMVTLSSMRNFPTDDQCIPTPNYPFEAWFLNSTCD